MKKTIYIVIIILILFVNLQLKGQKVKKFEFKLSGIYIIHNDSNYKQTYGNSTVFPEFEFKFNINQKLFLWAGLGIISNNAEIFLREESFVFTSKQSFLSLGLGFKKKLNKKIKYLIDGGITLFKFNEEVDSDIFSDSAVGFRIDAGIVYDINRFLFIEIKLGYLNGSKDTIKLGGIISSFGLGLKF